MFTYFHCYLPETWDAQIKSGLIDRQAGVRFCQSLMIDEKLKFNRLAAKGGRLWNIVREGGLPLYIDRLQGGSYFEGYDYDQTLVRAYRELLGDRFYGFQMHEWLSNYRSDVDKLVKHNCREWTESCITETIFRAYPYPYLFLESHSAKEMAENGRPETWRDFLAHGNRLFTKRQAYTNGLLIPCDSAYLAPKPEIEHGAKRLMPEIGAQTADTRIQMAYIRGMARAYGIDFGAYYEPWGGKPFSACCCHREGKNEWGIGEHGDFPFETMGENGGSSRSLQLRIQLYAYLTGAQFISEEWGMCNTFYDWRDFGLTPYGRTKLEFLRFTRRYPDIGRHYTPIAAVLPKDLAVLEHVRSTADEYCGYPVTGDMASKIRAARAGLRTLFCDASPMRGDETRVMINSPVPDAFDIVHEDSPGIDRYEYFIDLTGGGFVPKHGRTCTAEEALGLVNSLMPCALTGNVHWFVNRRNDDWLLTVFNHSGIERTAEKGDCALPDAGEKAVVTLKNGTALQKLEGNGTVCRQDGGYVLELPPGGWLIGAF